MPQYTQYGKRKRLKWRKDGEWFCSDPWKLFNIYPKRIFDLMRRHLRYPYECTAWSRNIRWSIKKLDDNYLLCCNNCLTILISFYLTATCDVQVQRDFRLNMTKTLIDVEGATLSTQTCFSLTLDREKLLIPNWSIMIHHEISS